ncbi:protein FAR1-RELATED SEQUENCE 5-like [Carya illinoinensis]|uniref:protein FAR1-RELATED SEQUENCE 5-like n=1 Tax=Carya illinoinensis TaxID=32201 RepID=UPI001C728BC8|nr:protein FAR1-RELATED SEQUENCE 5-like [Carya illinoinensis]
MKEFGWSSDSDDVEMLMSRNCPRVVNESIEDETVDDQCDANAGNGLNMIDGVNLGDVDGVNFISTSSSGPFDPFIGKEFDEVEDAQAFYKVDENGCMGSCFWTDARSRSAYQYFGDVVTFDAKYLTNVYKMPFVPFSGVNHHHQTIMFGCALLVNETAESYIWLLRTWQEAMLGRAPSTIITDDDKAMAKAIAEVLPNTTHRLCLWHILQKFPEHLAHVYNKFPEFQKEFHHCIHEIVTSDEFEEEWVSIVVKYGLVGNDWLQNLYNRREKWVPAYLRTTFCAGMSTTQRSESMNKFFKDYVRASTMVSDFVHQYEKALDARYFKEKEKDVRTKSTRPVLKTCWEIEEEAAKVYTRKSFNIFQDELFNCQRYKATKVHQEGESKTYEVAPRGNDKRIYYVSLDCIEAKAICICHMFEFLGIMCRHILCVFMKKNNLDCLPHHYVLERWTINAKSRAICDIPNSEGHVSTQEDPTIRKSRLMMQFYDIAELGSQSRFKMDRLSLALDKVHKELLLMGNVEEQNFEVGDMSRNDSPMLRSQVISNFSQTIQDPQRLPTKGRPKSLRAKNPRETQSVKKRRCSICKIEGHTKNNCPSLGNFGNFDEVDEADVEQYVSEDKFPKIQLPKVDDNFGQLKNRLPKLVSLAEILNFDGIPQWQSGLSNATSSSALEIQELELELQLASLLYCILHVSHTTKMDYVTPQNIYYPTTGTWDRPLNRMEHSS